MGEGGEMFGFVGDILWSDEGFKGVWLDFEFIWATNDGKFWEVEVHVSSFGKLLEFVYLWLNVLDVGGNYC